MTASSGKDRTSELAGMETPPVVPREEWDAAREKLLVKEKKLTKARDALAAERRRMSWLRIDKHYAFEAPAAGPVCSICSRDGGSSLSIVSSLSTVWKAGPIEAASAVRRSPTRSTIQRI